MPIRDVFTLLVGAAWCCAALAARPFGFEDVAARAAELARVPYRAPQAAAPQLVSLTYDEYRRIQFRASHSLWRDAGLAWQGQFFHAGRDFKHAIAMFELVDGQPRPIVVPRAAFDGDGLALPATAPVAGFRLLHPLNQPGRWDEVIAFLGASYFRALGTGQRYGASARAIAVDTTGGRAEEFPDFTTFWLERPAPGAKELRLYALLDGPRLTGAYGFVVRPGATTQIDVQARLMLREPVAMLGIAPLSSMFLAGENQPSRTDFRPEVHDSDGLQIATAGGEWIWRPLTNPARPFVTSFTLASPRGFGLMQRDRAFASYEDLEAHYERRPAVWVEPLGDWGAGRVELLQFNTPDETHDNVAAYWVPQQLPRPGERFDIAWRLHWAGDAAPRPPGAMVTQTRTGHGWFKNAPANGQMRLHLDFDAPPGSAVPDDVQPVVTGNANLRGLRALAKPNPVRGGWRVTIDFERIDPREPVELRAFLHAGDRALSETWSYALAPER